MKAGKFIFKAVIISLIILMLGSTIIDILKGSIEIRSQKR